MNDVPALFLRLPRWTGQQFVDDFGKQSAGMVELDGEHLFAELAVLRLLEKEGWSGRWVEARQRQGRGVEVPHRVARRGPRGAEEPPHRGGRAAPAPGPHRRPERARPGPGGAGTPSPGGGRSSSSSTASGPRPRRTTPSRRSRRAGSAPRCTWATAGSRSGRSASCSGTTARARRGGAPRPASPRRPRHPTHVHARTMTYLLAGAAALLLLAVVASRLAARRRVRRAARSIRSTMQAIYSGPHSYREVSLGDFPNLDAAFYEDKTGELAALDFSFLGDVEDVTVNRAQIGEPTAVRVMLSEDRAVLAFVYHVEAGGQTAKVVELETVLDDGRFVVTSTGRAAAPMSMPPEIDWQFHPGRPPGRPGAGAPDAAAGPPRRGGGRTPRRGDDRRRGDRAPAAHGRGQGPLPEGPADAGHPAGAPAHGRPRAVQDRRRRGQPDGKGRPGGGESGSRAERRGVASGPVRGGRGRGWSPSRAQRASTRCRSDSFVSCDHPRPLPLPPSPRGRRTAVAVSSSPFPPLAGERGRGVRGPALADVSAGPA